MRARRTAPVERSGNCRLISFGFIVGVIMFAIISFLMASMAEFRMEHLKSQHSVRKTPKFYATTPNVMNRENDEDGDSSHSTDYNNNNNNNDNNNNNNNDNDGAIPFTHLFEREQGEGDRQGGGLFFHSDKTHRRNGLEHDSNIGGRGPADEEYILFRNRLSGNVKRSGLFMIIVFILCFGFVWVIMGMVSALGNSMRG